MRLLSTSTTAILAHRPREPAGCPRSVRVVSESLTARADVSTDVPERYAKQLVSHLGRRTEWTTEGPTSTAEIAGGRGSVEVGEGVLTLRATAPDAETL